MSSRIGRNNPDFFRFNAAETDTIIEFYRAHPLLWQVTAPNYNVKLEKITVLQELAAIIGKNCRVNHLAYKWKGLKDHLHAEMRKEESGRPPGYISKWIYYGKMRFITELNPPRIFRDGQLKRVKCVDLLDDENDSSSRSKQDNLDDATTSRSKRDDLNDNSMNFRNRKNSQNNCSSSQILKSEEDESLDYTLEFNDKCSENYTDAEEQEKSLIVPTPNKMFNEHENKRAKISVAKPVRLPPPAPPTPISLSILNSSPSVFINTTSGTDVVVSNAKRKIAITLIEDGLKHLRESDQSIKDEDNYDRFGKEIAASLRALPERQRAMAEIDIRACLFRHQFGFSYACNGMSTNALGER